MLVKQNDIVEESANSSEQQYASMDDRNPNESNADINISETTAVDKDNGSNNKADDSTSNDTWSKDDPVIKTFLLGENTDLKIVFPENDHPFFLFQIFGFEEILQRWIFQRLSEYAFRVIDSNGPLSCKSAVNEFKKVALPEKNSLSYFFIWDLLEHLLSCILVKVSHLQKWYFFWERFESIVGSCILAASLTS